MPKAGDFAEEGTSGGTLAPGRPVFGIRGGSVPGALPADQRGMGMGLGLALALPAYLRRRWSEAFTGRARNRAGAGVPWAAVIAVVVGLVRLYRAGEPSRRRSAAPRRRRSGGRHAESTCPAYPSELLHGPGSGRVLMHAVQYGGDGGVCQRGRPAALPGAARFVGGVRAKDVDEQQVEQPAEGASVPGRGGTRRTASPPECPLPRRPVPPSRTASLRGERKRNA